MYIANVYLMYRYNIDIRNIYIQMLQPSKKKKQPKKTSFSSWPFVCQFQLYQKKHDLLFEKKNPRRWQRNCCFSLVYMPWICLFVHSFLIHPLKPDTQLVLQLSAVNSTLGMLDVYNLLGASRFSTTMFVNF